MMSRMVKFCYEIRIGINSCQIRALVKVAINTREGKIIKIIRATMSPWDDVLYMKNSQRGILLPELAVLTKITGSFSNTDSNLRSYWFSVGTRLCVARVAAKRR